jgi:hypothetical protein
MTGVASRPAVLLACLLSACALNPRPCVAATAEQVEAYPAPPGW